MTSDDIVGPWADSPDLTAERTGNIRGRLLPAVNALLDRLLADGVDLAPNPQTGTLVSGQTLGGFRPQDCTIGAKYSNHKQGLAVDIYDPAGSIDRWCCTHLAALAECGIWIEHPDATRGWSHWQCVPPRSGSRIFKP